VLFEAGIVVLLILNLEQYQAAVAIPPRWGWLVVLGLTAVFVRLILSRMRSRDRGSNEWATRVTQSGNQLKEDKSAHDGEDGPMAA
jgi:hypothetical protein